MVGMPQQGHGGCRMAQRVLVTGCSTGIGRATAVELGARGYEVIATARRLDSIDDLPAALAVRLDVDDEASVRAAVAAAGHVDALVNNAGFGVVGPVETVPLEPVQRMFNTNVFGLLRMVQAVAPQMRARRSGTIVNVSSVAGRASTHLNGLYAATKHAVEAISEAMHHELTHFGIRTVVVEPGYVRSSWSASEQWLGVGAPYEELYRQVRAGDEASVQDASPPELVAEVIADAIESDGGPFRWPAGPDAELVLRVRSEVDDDTWASLVRATTNVEW